MVRGYGRGRFASDRQRKAVFASMGNRPLGRRRKRKRSLPIRRPKRLKRLMLEKRPIIEAQGPKPIFYSKEKSNYRDSVVNRDYSKFVVNRICDVSSTISPECAPLIETCRFLYNNQDEIKSTVNIIFSKQSVDSKIENLVGLTKEKVKFGEGYIASTCASKLTEIIDFEGGFSKVSGALKLDLNYQNKERFRNFFQSSVENLISDSL